MDALISDNNNHNLVLENDAAADSTKTFHSLPDLPTELKLEVLAHALAPYKHDRSDADSQFLQPMIQANHNELANLALDVYYGDTIFVITIRYPALLLPTKTVAAKIRHLEVRADDCETWFWHTSTMHWTRSDWRYILNPIDEEVCDLPERDGMPHVHPAGKKLSTEWQKRFTNLRTLKFELGIYLSCRHFSARKFYKDLMSDADMVLKADKVKVELNFKHCVSVQGMIWGDTLRNIQMPYSYLRLEIQRRSTRKKNARTVS